MTEARAASARLAPTPYIDSDAPEVARFVAEALRGLEDAPDRARAIRLFEAVRDGLRYDPWSVSFEAADYRASAILARPSAYCVPKAILLTAALRHSGIPAEVGFADVKNHLNSPKLSEAMGTDTFLYHGYVQLWLGDETFKVTPAFNMELCERFGVKPLIFDGHSDALFHEADAAGRRHMEYVNDRGTFLDPPVERLLEDFTEAYPTLREMSLTRAQARDETFHGLRRLEDFEVGETHDFTVGPFTAEEIKRFAAKWDPQLLHLDEAHAEAVHGSLIASGFQTLLEVMRPVMTHVFREADNVGGLGIDALRWKRPVRPGDVLSVRLEITGLRPSASRPGRGVLSYRLEAHDAAGEPVLHLSAAAMLRTRAA